LVRDAAEGAVARRKIKFPDMSRFWNEFPQLNGNSARFIEEDRDR